MCNSPLPPNIAWMLEYNRDRWIFLVIVAVHLSILVYQVVKSAVYASISNERNPDNDEFINPIVRYLEANYFIDLFRHYKRCRILNRAGFLLSLQFLILRLRCLRERYRTASVNKYQYRRLNVVQMHMATAEQFYTSLRGWFELIRFALTANCDHNSERAYRQKALMKRLHASLRHAGKIDKVYYFNQIEFDACFQHKYYFRDYPSKLPKLKRAAKGWRLLRNKLTYLLAVKHADDRPHVALPIYRAEPFDWAILVIAYTTGLMVMIAILISAIIHIWTKELVGLQVDFENFDFNQLVSKLSASPRSRVTMIEACLTFVIIAFNVFDNALLAYSSMLCHSRVKKVIKLIKNQVAFHRAHLHRFCLFLDQRKVDTSSRLQYLGSRPLRGPHLDKYYDSDSNVLESNPELELDGLIGAFVHKLQDNNPQWTSINLRRPPKVVALAQDEAHQIALSIDEYRVQVNEAAIVEFNDDLIYLVDLIYVLETELNDLKTHFTFYLNLNILFGAAGSALTFAILVDPTAEDDLVLVSLVSFINVVPLVNALFMAASSEGSVSNEPTDN